MKGKFLISFSVLLSLIFFSSLAQAANIAVLSNDGEGAVAADFNANITGHTFTGINVDAVTPTLASLLAYDAILLFENGTFANAVNVGNRLAEYANTGRPVVLGTFYDQDRSDGGFGGSWGTLEILDPNTTDGVATPYAYRSLNPASIVPHPLTTGVTSLWSDSYAGGNQAKAGTTVLAVWDQLNANNLPDPVIAYRVTGPACVIHIGIFPDYPSFGGFGGDFYPVWRNAFDFAAAGCDAQPSCVAPPTGMVSWWPGEGTANDMRGTNHGTLMNGATFAAGKVGQAFSLDGVNDFVQVPDSSSLDITAQITIDAWIKPTALGTRIVDKITAGGSNGYLLDTFGGVVRLIVGSQGLSGATGLPLNTWTHVAGTYDGATLRVYVNGVLDGSFAAAVSIPTNNLPLRIGADSTGANLFNGLIDEVEIFNRALSAAEIQSIYNAGSAGKCRAIMGNIRKLGTGPSSPSVPLAGVEVALSGDATATTTTDANGNYTLPVLLNGSYMVIPSYTGYSFSPVYRNVSVTGVDVTGQNFIGTYTGGGAFSSISGKVTTGIGPASRALSNVTIYLTGTATYTTTTDAAGNYTFPGLPNGSYTITPEKPGYVFTPVNRNVALSGGSNVTGQNFTGALSP